MNEFRKKIQFIYESSYKPTLHHKERYALG